MYTQSFFKQLLVVVCGLLLASCDKDYNEIGADLIDQNNSEFTSEKIDIFNSTWKETGSIASNNLEINSLGILDNPVFGQTTANFVTQVQLANTSPNIDFNLDQSVESVTLYIPYFSKITSIKTDGRPVYELDSIYGNKTSKIKLEIYENKYLLGNKNFDVGAPILDPNFPKLYYTDQNLFFNQRKGDVLYTKDDFVFSSDEIKVTTPADGTTAQTDTYFAPGMRLDLDKAFFEDVLFHKSNVDYDLSSNPNFEQYFKGLYFNVEKTDATGVLARMNFKKGTIVVKYKEKATADAATRTVDKSITLNLTGNTVNLLDNQASTETYSYSSPKADRLYLRGGEGSVATINLFNPTLDVVTYVKTDNTIDLTKGNGIPDELDYIKEKGLINEASLTFYVDQTLMANAPAEPTTIFLYDMHNKQILSAGVLEKDASGKGLKYKVSITDYIRKLVNNDNEEIVPLGVCVAQGISNTKFKKVKNEYDDDYATWKTLTTIEQNAYFFPEASVMNPLGTILHGSNSEDASKKLKLEIYYTKPN